MMFQKILNPAFAENVSCLSQNTLLNPSSYFLFGIPLLGGGAQCDEPGNFQSVQRH